MRRATLVGSFSTLVLFAACGGTDSTLDIAPVDGGAEGGSGARDATASHDGTTSNDAGPNDATISDASNDAASNDATNDALNSDANAIPNDAAIDASDAQADANANDSGSDASAIDGGADAGADAADAAAEAGTDAGITPSALTLDEAFGANTYGGGLSAAGNWAASGTLVASNSGTQWFGSGNGSNNAFPDLYFKKQLGGMVENRTYAVSFYVVLPEDGEIMPIALSNFTVLRIGGPNGTVTWTSTPSPTVTDVWVKWTGTYVPAPADVGGPFYFEIKFDLPSKHSMGVDGPIGIE